MQACQLKPMPVQKCNFDKEGSNLVPKAPGCYVLCRSDGMIFYIGQAKNLRTRIRQHLKNPQKTGKTQFGVASVVYFLEYPREKIDSLENTWIRMHKNVHCGNAPLFNKIDAPVRF